MQPCQRMVDNSILETGSEFLMGVPALVSLQQAATRSICRHVGYKCCSVDLTTPEYSLRASHLCMGRKGFGECTLQLLNFWNVQV